MTNPERWSTKADILKDLAQVSTTITIDVDEQDIVVGEKPPPPRRFEQDDEFNYRFGDYDYGKLHEDGDVGPDLEGITHMLRMVNEFENPSEDDLENTPKGDVEVVVSKLNPNVPEFVPKGATTSSLSDKDNEAVADKNSISVSKSKNTRVKKKCNINQNIDNKQKDCNGNIDINKRIDISKLNSDAIKDITTKLRNKISGQSNDDPQGKRDKNVAIATLLKIYAANSGPAKAPSPVENEKPIKLITPQYFENCHANNTVEEVMKDETGLSNNNDSVSDLIKLSVSSSSKKSECVDTSSDMNINSSTTNSLVSKSPVRNRCYEDPQVRESIKKVNNWFDKPKSPKPKGSVVCLGPISFKRKEVSSKSPTIASDVESKRSTPTDKGKTNVSHYKPSKYAEDLSKMYSERSKVLEQQKYDLWTRLEMEMKAKEEQMKKAKSGTSSSSPEETENTVSSDARSE